MTTHPIHAERPLIYLDHNATTPMHPDVLETMTAMMRAGVGNASSLHGPGQRARAAVEQAREEVARLVGAVDPGCIHFTSGGTESDNHALRGAMAMATGGPRRRLVISAVEHPAVRATASELQEHGVQVQELPVDETGRLRPTRFEPDTALVSVMRANNETGNLYDLSQLSAAAHAVGALVHSDVVQAAGKVVIDLPACGVDLASLSAHKLAGPQGVGALYVRPGLALPALLTGGGQERGRRSGTENAAGIAGFGVAARIARQQLKLRSARLTRQRNRFEALVGAELAGVRILGDLDNRLPNTCSMTIAGVTGEAMVIRLDAVGVAAATGSACSSGSGKPSPVLVAMGLSDSEIQGALRISLGWNTTDDEIEAAAAALVRCARTLRRLAPKENHV